MCFICEERKKKKETLMKSTRISLFREASLLRNDGKADQLEVNTTSIACHRNCFETYCSKRNLERLPGYSKRKTEEVPTEQSNCLRGTTNDFDRQFFFVCVEKTVQ